MRTFARSSMKSNAKPPTSHLRRPLEFPLRGAKQIAHAFGFQPRQLQGLIAKGETALKISSYPELNGHLTRALLPKERGRYLPVTRDQYDFILGFVLSQNERLAQKRNSRGQLTAAKDVGTDQAKRVGTIRLVPTGEPATYRIVKGCLEDLPNVQLEPFEIDAIGDPVIETTYADLWRSFAPLRRLLCRAGR